MSQTARVNEGGNTTIYAVRADVEEVRDTGRVESRKVYLVQDDGEVHMRPICLIMKYFTNLLLCVA